MLYCWLIFKHLLVFGDQNEHSTPIEKKKLHSCIALAIKWDNICQTCFINCEVLTLTPRALNLSSHFSPRCESLVVEIGDLPVKVPGKEMLAWREDTSPDGGVTLIPAGDPEEKWATLVFPSLLWELAKCRAKGASSVSEGVTALVMFMAAKDTVMYFWSWAHAHRSLREWLNLKLKTKT